MKQKIISIINKIKWNLERIIYKIDKKKLEEGLPKGKKIILAPHSDDEWIGCSQIIKKEQDTIIVNMDMSGSDSKETHKLRYNEMASTATVYGIKFITLAGNKVQKLSEVIKKEKPKYICVPYFIDWHNEHIEVMNALKKAINDTNNNYDILMYQVSLPMYLDDITHYNEINKKDWKTKWKYFQNNYKTQDKFPYYRFATNERINGKIFGKYAVETYSIVSLENWIDLLNSKKLNDKQSDEVKKLLYSIIKTRNYLNESRKN